MKTTFSFIQLFTVASLALQGTVDASFAHPKYKPSTAKSEHVISGSYIVHTRSPDAAHALENKLLAAFATDVQIDHKFTHSLFSGVSVTLADPEPAADHTPSRHEKRLAQLMDHDDVVSVHQSHYVPRPTAQTFRPLYNSSQITGEAFSVMMPHNVTQVDRVHKELNNTGKGILACVIDSGVDYMLPALGGGFGEGYKIRYGKDLVGNDFKGGDDTPHPRDTPLDDCPASAGAEGHGTHVTGIIAAESENYHGVAPGATIGHWRVFGCQGGTSDPVVIQAILMARDAKCDVINVSLGVDGGWTEGASAVVVSNVAAEGIPVIVAAGNIGVQGSFTLGTPGTGVNSTDIAAFDNSHNLVPKFIATGIHEPITYASGEQERVNPNATVVLGDKDIGSGHDACTASTVPATVSGQYALVQRGGCPFDDKAKNTKAAGAIGVIVYDPNKDTVDQPTVTNPGIPVLGIGKTDGAALVAAVKAGKVDLTFNDKLYVIDVATAFTVSDFSSVGPAYELELRPNFGGVGGYMLSTLPRYLGGWGILANKNNGTRPTTRYMQEQFQNYASVRSSANGRSDIDTPIRQGAGLIQGNANAKKKRQEKDASFSSICNFTVYDAIMEQVHISPGQLSFNDTSSSLNKIQTITITNNGPVTIAYDVSNNASLAVMPYDLEKTGYALTEPINYTVAEATLRITPKNIKVAPGSSVQVQVSVIPPNTDPKQHIMYGGYVQLTPTSSPTTRTLSLPYFGIAGRQKDLPIFDAGYPYLSYSDTGAPKIDGNDTVVFNGSQVMNIFTRLVTPSALMQFEIVDSLTSLVLGKILPDLTYITRNYLDEGLQYNQLVWDGQYSANGNDSRTDVPKGTYRLKISSLKMFGDPRAPTDFDAWTSGPITFE
ncbi:peptidase S8/S53 domain-containing protein [Gongronella butleri]|nr:peptidase S8/S53 domain-containing protein [Gongronella butleri]